MVASSQRSSDELVRARLAFITSGDADSAAPRLADEEPPEPDQRTQAPEKPAAAPSTKPLSSSEPGWLPILRLPPLSRGQLLAIVALLGCGLALTVFNLTRQSAAEMPVPAASSPQVEYQSPSPSPEPQLRIHVLGAVAKPGVVTLPDGAIVLDAIQKAGGLTSEASPGELNLAAQLADGQQILVGTKDKPGGELRSQGAANTSEGALNLNTATLEDLKQLPGVGPVLAQAIVAYREEHGSYESVQQLQEVSGIGPKSFKKLEPLVRV